MRLCVLVTVSLVLVALLLLGIFLLLPFPLAVFPAIIRSQVYLQHKKDGNLPRATSYWANLPAIQHYDFYFFNLTNPDEVVKYGAKANLVEVGPYSYAETEFKEDITFFDDDKHVYYYNNKTWVFDPANSCPLCTYQDVLTMPNPAYMVIVYMGKTQGLPPVFSTFGDILLLLLGEYPTRTVPMAGVTFEGYPDPLVDLVNSVFVQTLINITAPNAPIPHIPAMGYFPYYNHTNDGDYVSLTGKDNAENLGLIQKWCNESHLYWWTDDYAQDITNSGDGSFQKPQLKKTDTLKQFQSFICRSFYLHFDSETNIGGIPAYTFKMNNDTYDTTLQKNKGYRYENKEMVDFFPTWPCGDGHVYQPTGANCSTVDCGLVDNFCSSCCDGTHIHNGTDTTILFPPGIIPLRCLPGQMVDLPFAGFLTPPHFLWSPPEVQNGVYGMSPDESKHHPGSFDINPTTGSTVNAAFRLQLVVPFYTDPGYTMLQNTGNNFIPTFWINLHIDMQDYAKNYLHFVTAILPKIILGLGIGLTALSVVGGGLFLFCIVREKKQKRAKQQVYDEYVGEGKEAWN